MLWRHLVLITIQKVLFEKEKKKNLSFTTWSLRVVKTSALFPTAAQSISRSQSPKSTEFTEPERSQVAELKTTYIIVDKGKYQITTNEDLVLSGFMSPFERNTKRDLPPKTDERNYKTDFTY